MPLPKNKQKEGIDFFSFEDGVDPLATVQTGEPDSSEILADVYEQPVSDLDGVGVDVPTEPVVVDANDEAQDIGVEDNLTPETAEEQDPEGNRPSTSLISTENWFQSFESLLDDVEAQVTPDEPTEAEQGELQATDGVLGVPDVVTVVDAKSVDAIEPAEDDGVNVVLPEDAPKELVAMEGLVAGDDTPPPDIISEVEHGKPENDGSVSVEDGNKLVTDEFASDIGEVEIVIPSETSETKDLENTSAPEEGKVLATAERFFISLEDGIDGLIEGCDGDPKADPVGCLDVADVATMTPAQNADPAAAASTTVEEPATATEPPAPPAEPATEAQAIDQAVESWLGK